MRNVRLGAILLAIGAFVLSLVAFPFYFIVQLFEDLGTRNKKPAPGRHWTYPGYCYKIMYRTD